MTRSFQLYTRGKTFDFLKFTLEYREAHAFHAGGPNLTLRTMRNSFLSPVPIYSSAYKLQFMTCVSSVKKNIAGAKERAGM